MKNTSPIRVRMAPSPTGNLHIGTARSTLFNYLFAKHHGGRFIVRIEDTDRERSKKEFEDDILDGFEWLGLIPNESPRVGGAYGPYRQSERLEHYRTYLLALLDRGAAFYCFHSVKELEQERAELMERKHPPLHLCEYRTLEREAAKALIDVKKEYVIRFKTPGGVPVTFHDLIRGPVTFESGLIGDFSIAKNLDEPLYNFAVVVDDFEMKISHVIRGEDHIANTPKQILIAEALGFPQPTFAHLPLLLGPDRSKLSKRHGATAVREYREQGYLPEAIFNFTALLGWSPGGNREIMSPTEIVEAFTLDHVQKAGAIFDIAKLDWMNAEYIRAMTPENLLESARPFLPKNTAPDEYLKKILDLERPRLKRLAELRERTDYFFTPPTYEKELLSWKGASSEETLTALARAEALLAEHRNAPIADIETRMLTAAAAEGDRGKLLWPLRVALSGKSASPGPFELIRVLGIEESVRRVMHAKKIIEG